MMDGMTFNRLLSNAPSCGMSLKRSRYVEAEDWQGTCFDVEPSTPNKTRKTRSTFFQVDGFFHRHKWQSLHKLHNYCVLYPNQLAWNVL